MHVVKIRRAIKTSLSNVQFRVINIRVHGVRVLSRRKRTCRSNVFLRLRAASVMTVRADVSRSVTVNL